MSPRSAEQFDLFAKPPRKSGGEMLPSLPEEPAGDESYEPTPEDEQARIAAEHGPNVQYIPPKSRKEREAEERRRKAMLDDTLGRLGASGHQLLTDDESPFARAAREEEEQRKRKKKE
ncbi:MAG: hypothetical protein Q8R16_02815 [bacterium]|nr:hypothetical protein [bacterium]